MVKQLCKDYESIHKTTKPDEGKDLGRCRSVELCEHKSITRHGAFCRKSPLFETTRR